MISFNTISAAVSSTNFRGGISPALIDQIEINGIESPINGTPKRIFGRSDEDVELAASAYLAGVSVPVGVAFTWYISDSATGDAVDVLTGVETAVTLDPGKYDILLEGTGVNTFNKRIRRALLIHDPSFLEVDADLVIDLAQVQSNTWSNPLANLTYVGGTNSLFDFQDVVRAGFKIAIKNSFTGFEVEFNGLRGTEEQPVKIQNVGGQVTLTSTSTGVMFHFTAGCQYIDIDGRGTEDEYGFKFNGRTSAGIQSQLMYFDGASIVGIRMWGIDFDQKRGSGATDGGACCQFTCTATASWNYANSYEYIEQYGCRFRNCWGEGDYVGFFEDAVQPSGFRPCKTGHVLFFCNIIDTCERDGYQQSLSESLEAHTLYINNCGLEGSSSHNSIISFNDGNQDSFLYEIVGSNAPTFTSAQNGQTGIGNYHFYNFRFLQGTFTGSTPTQAMFFNVETNSCNFFVYNFSLDCPDVSIAAACVQYDNPSTAVSLGFTFAAGMISTETADGVTWDELRTVNTGSTDRTGWLVDNQWELTANEADLMLDMATMRPDAQGSPCFGGGFDWETRFGAGVVKGGYYDMDGYSLTVDTGSDQLSAGCFSGFELWVE